MNLNETQLLQAYRKMCQIRAFEDRVHEEFATGEIPGFVHRPFKILRDLKLGRFFVNVVHDKCHGS